MKNTSDRKILHIDRVNPSPLWNYKQEDDGVLLLSLYKGGQTCDVTGQTITLGVKNAQGQLIEHKTGITINKSSVDIVLNNSIFAVKGKLECDLILKDSNGQMSTATFYLLVGQKVLGEDNILSSNVIPTIDKIATDFENRGNKLIDDVTKDYCQLQTIMIDENASANLQNQINDVNSSLDNKANVLDVRKSTNLQAINVNEMDSETKALFTGGAVAVVGLDTIGNENIKNGVISPSRLNYMQPQKNLFDKNATKLNTTLVTSTGEEKPYEGEQISDYIKVESSTSYTNSHTRPVVFYNTGKKIISVSVGQKTYTTPSDCAYIRTSLLNSQSSTFQVEKGTVSTSYANYCVKSTNIIPDSKMIETKSITMDKIDINIGIEDTNFVVRGKNLYNKETIIIGKNVSSSNGTLIDSGGNVSDFIPVIPDTTYVINKGDATTVAMYSADKSYLGFKTLSSTTPITTVSNCKYIRFNIFPAWVTSIPPVQFEQGTTPTDYEDYSLNFIGTEKSQVSDISIGVENTNFINVGKNLFDVSSIVRNKRFDLTTGDIVDSSGHMSELIPVEPSETYIINASDTGKIGLYTKKGLYIGWRNISSSSPVKLTDDCYYVRLNLFPVWVTTFLLQFEKNNIPTKYEKYIVNILGDKRVKINQTVTTNTLSNTLKDDKVQKANNDIKQFGHSQCSIPCYDDTLSICHPSVVYASTGWNGYKYWMGYTPYPQSPEEPCIVASNDGINWEEPKGIVNPIFTLANAKTIGYTMTSDTHLILSADKTKLMLYFRTMYGYGEGIHLATSTDGVNWTITTDIIKIPYTLAGDGTTKQYISIMSPAVILESDNTFTMWSINSTNGATKTVEKRTSTDGIVWSNPTSCTSNDNATFTIYHIDVKKYNGTYYMLALGNPGGLRLRLLQSSDGANWNFVTNKDIPLSGFDWDYNCHYRSTFIPKSNGKFDLWLNGVKYGTGNAWSSDSQWRVCYYKDVDLINNVFKTAPKITVYYGSTNEAPTTATGYANGDRYEYTNPSTSIGRVLISGTWKEFGQII